MDLEIFRKMKLTCSRENISEDNIEIHTVEVDKRVITKTKPFMEDLSHLNVIYEDDGKYFRCEIIDTGTRMSYTGKHPRYKKRAYKEAFNKYLEDVSK